MKKVVSSKEYCLAFRDFLRDARRKFGNSIEFCEMAVIGLDDQPCCIGVNWAALGTVVPVEADAFAKTLAEAAEAARGFKYNGYEVVFD